ncbi:MAG: EAL domain-containing protein [Planctomycetota bacterium]
MKSLITDLSQRLDQVSALLDALPMGVAQFDANLTLNCFNSTFAEMFEIPQSDSMCGAKLAELLTHVPDSVLGAALSTSLRTPSVSHVCRSASGQTLAVESRSLDGGGFLCQVQNRGNDAAESRRVQIHDSLTSLLERTAFQQECERNLKSEDDREIALLFVDLDRFKSVNDTFGHAVGDEVLKVVAARIRQVIRSGDVVSRLGGDEFAIMQVEAPQPRGSRSLATRLINSLCSPIEAHGHTVTVGASVGIAVAPFDGENSMDLMKNADLAMYRAKQDGGSVLRYFEPEMEQQMNDRRSLESALKNALEGQEFEIRYQPIVDVLTDKIVTVEALLRWRNDSLGSISPDMFVPVAEDSGLIKDIGKWVLTNACRAAVTWRDDVRIAVNVSPVQLRHRDFVRDVVEVLRETGLSPNRLELEITESALLSETELTIAILKELRSMGIKIAMDDFGTGYASINHLRRFQFDKIKIDRSFVSGVNNNAESAGLIRMIASLGTCLAVTTTAEGVETLDELETVRKAGCSQVQGYLLSKPILEQKVTELLSTPVCPPVGGFEEGGIVDVSQNSLQ